MTPSYTAITALVRPDVETDSVPASILGLHTGDSKLRADRVLGIEDGVTDEVPRRLWSRHGVIDLHGQNRVDQALRRGVASLRLAVPRPCATWPGGAV